MESQHSTKINKYLALRTTIESNGWFVELSAVEVGARGYRSKSVLCCLKKLGFNNSKIWKKLRKKLRFLKQQRYQKLFSNHL